MMKTLLCLLVAGLIAAPLAAQKGPRIRASETGWNFGVRTQGEKDVKKVTIYNDGDQLLKISDIKLTCGCVRGDMTQREIEPGKSAELDLVLTTYQSIGLIRKHCYLFTNDPKMPQLVLTVEGEIKGDWSIDHNQVDFGEALAGTDYTQSFRVLRRNDAKIKLLSVESPEPNLDIKTEVLADEEKGDYGWIITLTLKGTAPKGPFAAAIAVKTDHRLTPYQNVMVYAKIDGPVALDKLSKIHMGRVFEGAEARRNLQISITDGSGYVVTGVTVDCPAVEVHLRELDPGITWEVELIVTGRKGDDNMNEVIKITTSHPLQREIHMALNWVTRPVPPKAN